MTTDSDAVVRVVIEGQRIGYPLSQAWVPLPPGITSLPAAPAPVPDVTYGEVLTPTALLRPYQEAVRVDCVVRVFFSHQRLEYALTLPDRNAAFIVRPVIDGVQFRGDVDGALAPRIVMSLVERQLFQATTLIPRVVFANNPYDADAQDYINRVEAVSGNSGLEVGVKDAFNAFVVGLKADGNWSALDGATCILMGAKNVNGALVPLKSSMPTQSLAGGSTFPGSADYNRKTGLKAVSTGNTEDDHIRTGINANRTGAQNSNHLCMRITWYYNVSGGTQYICGAKRDFHNLTLSSTASYNMSTSYQFHSTGPFEPAGYSYIANRTSNGSYVHIVEDNTGSQNSQTKTVTGTNNGTTNYIAIMAYNDDESGSYNTSGLYGDEMRSNFYSVGAGLADPAAFLTRIRTLETDIAAAIP